MTAFRSNLEVGRVVGDYEIVSVLGRGGMGKVFKVRNLISERVEAMKVVLPDLEASPDLVQRFLREIKVVADLEHPNIASLRTALRVEDQFLMIMEYVEGTSLDDLLKQGRLDEVRAVHVTYQVLNALAHAHGRGVVHRDVKPSNIMVGPGDRVKITDFGIASRSGDPKLTAAGTAVGSLYYMSPEQVRAEAFDARSDLYSVGATLYEMVTGRRPVQGDSFYAILKAHTEGKPLPAIQLVPEITPALSYVIEKSLEKLPELRFQSANDFRTALISLSSRSRSQPAEDSQRNQQRVSETPADPIRTATPNPIAPAKVPSDTGSRSWDPALLENVRRDLAVYIGPMAKILVSRVAKNTRTVQELYQVLALEIASPADRERFLRSQPS
jgi:serine/threonine protein kinase